jgi:hypothetical protein
MVLVSLERRFRLKLSTGMADRSNRRAQGLALALVALSVSGALGWFWWNGTRRAEVNFLPQWPPA